MIYTWFPKLLDLTGMLLVFCRFVKVTMKVHNITILPPIIENLKNQLLGISAISINLLANMKSHINI